MSALECPHCGGQKLSHLSRSPRYRPRHLADRNSVARAWQCADCQGRWVSVETLVLGDAAEAVLEMIEERFSTLKRGAERESS